jgi:hypothetical protein
MPPLALPEEPRVPGSDFILPANPLTEMTDDLLAAFVECNLTTEEPSAPVPMPRLTTDFPIIDVPPPADSPVLITDAIPIETAFDPTIPNARMPRNSRDAIPSPGRSRDFIGTLLGMAPLSMRVHAAPTPVVTELVDRVATPPAVPIVATVALTVQRPSMLRRIRHAIAARLRRWWIPGTVAATVMAVGVWFTLTSV